MKKIAFGLLIFLVICSIGLIFYNLKKDGNQNSCPGTDLIYMAQNKNSKTALLIHGYPEPIYATTPIFEYFKNNNYSVIAPYLFTPEFKFTKDETKKYIEEKLGGRVPDVIVGISLGGLIAPYVAEDFPDAKLVMIGTGPYVRTGGEIVKMFNPAVYGLIKITPTWLYSIIYDLVNKPNVGGEGRKALEKHIRENWACVKSIPETEDVEVVNFLAGTDNSVILHSLKNKTIIFAGDGDVMMPAALSQKLHDLIKNSELIIGNSRMHFTVFDKDNWKDLDRFLGN